MNQKRVETLKRIIKNYNAQKEMAEAKGRAVISLYEYLKNLNLTKDEISFCLGENQLGNS